VALGTDTGGSVRIPAACYGITGLKTTWGRIPLDGVYPLAPSLDTVGPLGADVAAVELGMGLIEPVFAASAAAPGRVGRIRPDAEIDAGTDAAVDAALAAAGLRVTDLAGLDVRAVNHAGNVLIDVEAYQANAHLIPLLDRLTPPAPPVTKAVCPSRFMGGIVRPGTDIPRSRCRGPVTSHRRPPPRGPQCCSLGHPGSDGAQRPCNGGAGTATRHHEFSTDRRFRQSRLGRRQPRRHSRDCGGRLLAAREEGSRNAYRVAECSVGEHEVRPGDHHRR
jgi:hypothetical protein